MELQPTQDLIQRCKRQPEAQRELYMMFYRKVYNTCLRLLNHTAEAEDAMQDTFIKVFEKLDLYNPNTNFGAWINRIAINTSLDKIKVRKIQWLPLNEEYATRVDEHFYSHEEERNIQWKVEQVKEAIKMLPEGYRVILTLLLIEGLNSEEVAEYLKITPSTVRSQYTRARRRLVENLKKYAL